MKKVMKVLTLLFALTFCLSGCLNGCKSETKDEKEDDLVWTNENIVYAYVNTGYEKDILTDIENSFPSLTFQKVYVAEKNADEWTPLSLIFILDKTKEITQKEFIDLLEKDERISYANAQRDLPFGTVDTRYIERKKDVITVGETLELKLVGSVDYYVQPFDFKGFFVKPITAKQYSVKDFPSVDLKSVQEENDGWLYLELKNDGYFNVVKACDKIARLSTVEKVTKDRRNVVSVIPPIWKVADETIVRLETNTNQYSSVTVTGLKTGKTTVEYDGVKCEITVQ